jgi:hypothetical protein
VFDAGSVEQIAGHHPEDLEPVHARGPKARGRGLGEVADRDGDLGDAKPARHGLGDDFLVEDEAVRIHPEVDRFQHLAAEGAIARMELGEPEPERLVLDAREEAVGEVLPPGHPLLDGRTAALEPRAEHKVGLPLHDGLDDLRHQGRVVLIVRMDHDHDVGAGPERLRVTGLLVGAVAVVLVVDEDLEPQLPRDLERLVGGAVVHQDDQVDRVLRQLLVGEAQGPAGVVGRHDHDDLGLAHRRPPIGRQIATNW